MLRVILAALRRNRDEAPLAAIQIFVESANIWIRGTEVSLPASNPYVDV